MRSGLGKTPCRNADPRRDSRPTPCLSSPRAVSLLNGNTFATIGRELALALFSDLHPSRKREVSSVIEHYIAGVLDRENMVNIVEGLCEMAELKTGDRVKTLRGSLNGVILKILDDGKIVWQPDGTKSELTALPESLLRED